MKRFNATDGIILLTFILFMTSVDISHLRWLEWMVLVIYSVWAFLLGLKAVAVLKQSKTED
ncbi:hypothetical protein AB1K91_15315 [Terribacillus sp. 179-K 1B1 HS]|uniref:hypothetical protein n=1 Tax=Terribacillus sp. 179-K 1B1 HS TaxID=3142388 RepID=UPI00399F9E04